eukprot:GSMAST32.ASY1.ANO1.959.1 assembled CDS
MCTLQPGANVAFEQSEIQFSMSSPVSYPQNYKLDLESGIIQNISSHQDIHQEIVDMSEFCCYRTTVTASDGVLIPLTLAHHRLLDLNGKNPVLMHGYGSYGVPTDPLYSPEIVPNKNIESYAHVRGGGDLGRMWHTLGRGEKKRNTFSDFISCGEPMVSMFYFFQFRICFSYEISYLTKKHIYIYFHNTLRVPFLDITGSMSNSNLPLTIHEYEEWGENESINPLDDSRTNALIRSYCPYTNIKSQEYPAMLVTGSIYVFIMKFKFMLFLVRNFLPNEFLTIVFFTIYE